MYEAVHAHPDGDATVARHAATAERYGYEGIVVRTREALDPASSSSEHADEATALRDEYGIDVVDAQSRSTLTTPRAPRALWVTTDPTARLSASSAATTVSTDSRSRTRVDVLVRPMGGGDFNHVLAKAARDNGVHVEFDLGPLFRATGGKRVRALADLRKLREIVTYYDTPHVVSANPRSHTSTSRAPREVVAAAEAVGFDAEWVREGLRAWGEIATRNPRAPLRGLHRAGGPTWQV